MDKKINLDYIIYLVVRFVAMVVEALPPPVAQSFGNALAWLGNDLLGIRRKTIEDNLDRAFPGLTQKQKHQIRKEMWQHLFLMLIEIAHAPRLIHKTNWRHFVSLVDQQIVVNAMLNDRATIIATGHYGNFEVSTYIQGLLGFPTYTLARPLDNAYLDEFVNGTRSRHGQHIVSKDQSADRVTELIDLGETIAFLADQNTLGKGACWIDFFGTPVAAHKAIAVLSLTAEVPLIVVGTRRLDQPLHFEICTYNIYDPLLDEDGTLRSVPNLTRWYLAEIERMIFQAPGQYWWLHRRWRPEQMPDKVKKRWEKRKAKEAEAGGE